MGKQILFLNGSPKKAHSTSESICDYLIELLSGKNLQIEKLHIHALLKTKEGEERMLSAVNQADTIVFSCPLYIDAPPSMVMKAMELIAEHKNQTKVAKKQNMLAISNCGFPEAFQNDVALRIYRKFAQDAGFKWLGGLAFGMGAVTNGKPMKIMGFVYPRIRKVFNNVANALFEEKMIEEEIAALAAQHFIPMRLYTWIGNTITWRAIAIKNGVWNIYSAPYERKAKKIHA